MQNCPFCNPAKRVIKENALVFVILSNPRKVPGHFLVVPKRHVEKPWELTKEEVAVILGLVDLKAAQDLIEALISKNSDIALSKITTLVEAGADMAQFAKILTIYLRDLLLVSVEPGLAGFLEKRAGKEYADYMRELASRTSLKEIQNWLDLFIEAHSQVRYSPLPQLPLELAVIEATTSSEARKS